MIDDVMGIDDPRHAPSFLVITGVNYIRTSSGQSRGAMNKKGPTFYQFEVWKDGKMLKRGWRKDVAEVAGVTINTVSTKVFNGKSTKDGYYFKRSGIKERTS